STLKLLNQTVVASDRVKTIVMDMWDPFHKAVQKAFRCTNIVMDKYTMLFKR
ncbi:MAG: transposase, partial [Bacillales bacterium]|nr:transposase [Bacillales bacterium]